MFPLSSILLSAALLGTTQFNDFIKPIDENWVAVQTEKDLAIAAEGLKRAQTAYQNHFGTPPVGGLVIDINILKDEQQSDFDSYNWVLPWPFAGPQDNEASKAIEAQLRQQIKDQLIQAGEDASEARVEALLAEFRKKLNLGDSGTISFATPGIIAHEIGHQFFVHGIWGENAEASDTQYGSTAPDWLDEAAAILMEDAPLTQNRRDNFQSILQTRPATAPSQMFKAEHPKANSEMLQDAKNKARESSSGFSISANAKDNGKHSAFYAEVRAFLDYLNERSVKSGYMRSITLHLKSGGTMEGWLHEHGAEFGLMSTLKSLDADYFRVTKSLRLRPYSAAK